MYPVMEDIENIRILVGLNVYTKTVQIIQKKNSYLLNYPIRKLKINANKNLK